MFSVPSGCQAIRFFTDQQWFRAFLSYTLGSRNRWLSRRGSPPREKPDTRAFLSLRRGRLFRRIGLCRMGRRSKAPSLEFFLETWHIQSIGRKAMFDVRSPAYSIHEFAKWNETYFQGYVVDPSYSFESCDCGLPIIAGLKPRNGRLRHGDMAGQLFLAPFSCFPHSTELVG